MLNIKKFLLNIKKFLLTRRILKYPTLIFLISTIILSVVVIEKVFELSNNFVLYITNVFNNADFIVTILVLSLISSIFASLIGFILAYYFVFSKNRYINVLILFVTALCFLTQVDFCLNLTNFIYDYVGNIFKVIPVFYKIDENYGFYIVSITIYIILKYFSIAFVLFITPLTNINTTLIESSLDMGGNNLAIFRKYIIKSVKPQIILSIIIIFVLYFTAFPRIYSNTTFIYFNIKIQMLLIIIVVPLINIYFNKNRGKLFLPVNKRISKYKCISIGGGFFIRCFTLIGLIFALIVSVDTNNNIFEINNLSVAIQMSLISTILGTIYAISVSGNDKFKQYEHYKITIILILLVEFFYTLNYIISSYPLGPYSSLKTSIVHIFVGTIFSSIFMIRKVRQLDMNLENISLDLGANYFQTLMKVSVPALLSDIASNFLIIMLLIYNIVSHNFNLINLIITILILIIANPTKNISTKKRTNIKYIFIFSLLLIYLGYNFASFTQNFVFF